MDDQVASNQRQFIIEYLKWKNQELKQLGAILDLTASEDFNELNHWSKEQLQKVVRGLLQPTNSFSHSRCPWCVLHTRCKDCGYGERHKPCVQVDSDYYTICTQLVNNNRVQGVVMSIGLKKLNYKLDELARRYNLEEV